MRNKRSPIYVAYSQFLKRIFFQIGFETTSLFWDYQNSRKRRYYTCSISDRNQAPHFKVKAHSNGSDGAVFTSPCSKGKLLNPCMIFFRMQHLAISFKQPIIRRSISTAKLLRKFEVVVFFLYLVKHALPKIVVLYF